MIGSIIGLILVYLAYVYLRNLSDCSCVNQIFVERLKNIEALILTLSVVSLITSVIISIFMTDLYGSIEKFKKSMTRRGFSVIKIFEFHPSFLMHKITERGRVYTGLTC